VLAGAARGEMGSEGGGGPVRLLDVDTWELAGFQIFRMFKVCVILSYKLFSKVYTYCTSQN
jgi:hypothetical protein